MRTTANHESLVNYINRKNWWHVPPQDSSAYSKRGIFYSTTFRNAEFWGRPLDEPQKVQIRRPIVGDEPTVQKSLFGRVAPIPADDHEYLSWRFDIDARMKRAALKRGHDSIVILSKVGFERYRVEGRIPRGMELNVLVYPSPQPKHDLG